jgi:hypothetical protein
VCEEGWKRGRKRDRRTVPSSLPRTRFTAPEQPPQDMLTLNLYVCSDMVAGVGPERWADGTTDGRGKNVSMTTILALKSWE